MRNKEPYRREKKGPLDNSRPIFLAVAKINKPHGLRGEVSAELLTDFPENLSKEKKVFIGEKHKQLIIKTIRKMNKRYLISFRGLSSREDVDNFRNNILFVSASALWELSDDEYFYHDLLGMKVVNENGGEVGKLKEIISTGANDVYVISTANDETKEILIPAIKSVIQEVDIGRKRMIVKLPEWQ